MKPIAILSLVALCTAAAAAPPHKKSSQKKSSGPHYQAYGTFTGKRGEFRGRARNNQIPVISFKMNSGKKTSMTIESLDAQDFENALHSHEVLSKVEIDVMGPNIEGRIKIVQRIILQTVTVGRVKVRFSSGHEVDDLGLTYQTEAIEPGNP